MKKKILIPILTFAFLAVGLSSPSLAHADVFNSNRIIDDAVFNNTNFMSAAQVNNFLNGWSNSCISPNSGFQARIPSGYSPSTGYTYGNYGTAGEVIYESARVYGLNPAVLLTTLEKEQSLVTGRNNFAGYCNNGDQHKYAAAVGYGCPDSGTIYSYSGLSLYQRNGGVVGDTGTTCVNSASKAGFSQQVIRAAWLLKFGQQRALGNVDWAVISGNWNNSDDPQTCYGGPMTPGYRSRCPNTSPTYYDGYTTIDGAATRMDSGATAALYWYTPHFHGNQNFFDLYTSWFGTTVLPSAFKIENNPAIYVQAGGYRFYVPSVSILQDFGFGTGAQTISQDTANNIPAPGSGSGLSPGLNSVIVKSPSDSDLDGGSVYLISGGVRFQFTSMQQIADFGFTVNQITYLPLSFINGMPSGGWLSNFVQAPNYAIFQITAGTKRFILDTAAYTAANPSGALSKVNYSFIDSLPGGAPIATREGILSNSQGAIYLFSNGHYYYVPSANVIDCWGFNSTLGMQTYRLPNDNYLAPISSTATLTCAGKTDASTTYLLNGSSRILIPTSYGFSIGSVNSDLTALVNKLPARSSELGRPIVSTVSPHLWYLEGGTKKTVPSLTDMQLLGINDAQVERVLPGALAELPGNGLKFATGQVVRASDTGTIYAITSPTTKSWVSTPDDFSAYRYSWTALNAFPSSALDQYYTTNAQPLSRYLYSPSGGIYIIDPSGCYGFTAAQIDEYGQPTTAALAGQTYLSTIFPNLNLATCKVGSVYVKSPTSPTVYMVIDGVKRSFTSWAQLQSVSGQTNPRITTLSNPMMASLPTGPTL